MQVARQLNLPILLERPNAHTRFAYEVVRNECQKLGVVMPRGHEHEFNADILEREEAEFSKADFLLCPSDFVAQTFLANGFPPEKLLRHQYGYDEKLFFNESSRRKTADGITMLFAGGCAPRKGLHYALDAWLASSAKDKGLFLIAGTFIAGYAEVLAAKLSHPSVRILGQRQDLPELMRQSDIFILPSIEEGSALVTSEARGCGCVLLVSDAAGAICKHNDNALVHHVGDAGALQQQIDSLNLDRGLLERLRTSSLRTVDELTWDAAGKRLLKLYAKALKPNSEQL